jgi:colicin import membrane protein
MKSVRFTGHYRNYNAGEVAGFPDDHADELIARGFAVSEADALAAEKAEAEAKAAAEAAEKAAAEKAEAEAKAAAEAAEKAAAEKAEAEAKAAVETQAKADAEAAAKGKKG